MSTVKARKSSRKPELRKVEVTFHVKDSDDKRLNGIHVELKHGETTVHTGFTDRHGEIECPGLIPGEDYKVFVNGEEVDEFEAPRGDDEHEVEYDGDYTPGARADEAEEEEISEEAEDDDDEAEDDVDSLSDDSGELDF